MKRSILLLFFICISGMVSQTVLAGRGGRHSPPRHHSHHHSRAAAGLIFSAPLWVYPPYYSYGPYYPSQQTVIIQSTPTQYSENAEENQTPENYWYYCSDPKGYYPYVPKCNVNWQKVIPFPQDAQ